MKSKLGVFLISGALSSLSFSGTSNVCTAYPGSYICENGQVEHINGLYGSMVLRNITVSGAVRGNVGALHVKQSQLNQVKGNFGSFLAERTAFSGLIAGNMGVLLLKKSTINELNACATNVHLNQTTSGKITLSCNEQMKVVLKNKSLVQGDIHFTEHTGVVCVDDSSELKGQVVNGKLVRGSCKHYEG